MYVYDLIIEVTRKCNMVCDHCLRGHRQQKDITKEVIEKALVGVSEIGTVTFSGGEPSLNVQAILDFIEIAEQKGIDVQNFYIATNAKKYSEEFVLACLKMYSFCTDNEISSVQVSNSIWHDDNGGKSIKQYNLLKGLSFFSEREYMSEKAVINTGLAQINGLGYRSSNEPHIYDEYDLQEQQVYINVKGDVIFGCDYSYKEQEEYKVGNVFKNALSEIFKRTQKQLEAKEGICLSELRCG